MAGVTSLSRRARRPCPSALIGIAAALLTAFLNVRAAAAATDVWIDTDPAIGAPWRDVDDAFALVLAFRSPELRIAGISTTYGNAGVARTTAVARDLARRSAVDVDVLAGAASPRDFQTNTAAVDALARALRRRRLTYVALGPLTNLAAFLQQHPELEGRIERVIFVGGRSPGYEPRFGRNGWLRIHDANVFKDPEAVARVLRSRIPLLLAPVETSSLLVLSRDDWNALQEGPPISRFLRTRSGVWVTFWTRILRHPGGPLFDSLAVLLASHPHGVLADSRFASVERSDLIARVNKQTREARRVQFATELTASARRRAIQRLRHAERLAPSPER